MSGAGELPRTSLPRGRTVTELIRRGLDSALANWQILALRLGETVLIAMIAFGSALALIVPLLVSIGLSRIRLDHPDDAAEIMRSMLFDHWIIFVYIAVAISIALAVIMAIHSFVLAGAARIFLNAERAAGKAPPVRQRFAVFSIDQWIAGGRYAWWRVFWIYNIAYGVAGIVIMLPLLPLAGLIIIFQAAPAALVLSCLGLVIMVFLSLIVLVVTSIVCQKAIVVVALKPVDAAEALRIAWRAMRADFSRHFGVAFIMIVLSIGGSGAIGLLSLGFAAPAAAAPVAMVIFMPVRMMLSMASSMFSAAVSNWFLASFAALTVEEG